MLHSQADYCVTLHSDCLVKRSDWLSFLVQQVQGHAAAGPGELRLEHDPDAGTWPHASCSIWDREKAAVCIKAGKGWGADNEGLTMIQEIRRRGWPVNILPKGAMNPYVLHIWTGTRLQTDAGDAVVERDRALKEQAIRQIVCDPKVDEFWKEHGL